MAERNDPCLQKRLIISEVKHFREGTWMSQEVSKWLVNGL